MLSRLNLHEYYSQNNINNWLHVYIDGPLMGKIEVLGTSTNLDCGTYYKLLFQYLSMGGDHLTPTTVS